MEDNKKEIAEALALIKLQEEIAKANQTEEGQKQENDEVMLATYNANENLNKKSRIRDELEKKVSIARRDLESEKPGGSGGSEGGMKIKGDKYTQYVSFIESNLYEFGKIRNLIEKKEYERVVALADHQGGDKSAGNRGGSDKNQASLTIDYAKPQKSAVSVVYVRGKPLGEASGKKGPGTDAGAKQENDPLISNQTLKTEEGEEVKGVVSDDGQLERFYSTFRIDKETKLNKLHKTASAFWGFKERETELLDDTKVSQSNVRRRTVSDFIEQKLPMFYIYEKNNAAMSIKQTSGEEKSEEAVAEDKTGDDFVSQFLKYFYQFKSFFIIDPSAKDSKETGERLHMNDYHPTFILMMLFLLLFTVFAVILFYLRNESTMRSGFTNILSKFGDKTIHDIDSLSGILDYCKYMGTSTFKDEINKNFQFIGLIAIRQVRTKQMPCKMQGIHMNETCYQDKYTSDTKFYDPILFNLANGTQDYLYYKSEDHTKIKSDAQGLYSTYDGSGYLITFDHADPALLQFQNERFNAIAPVYFKENTKAVIINYNLHYPVLNVNLTAQVVGDGQTSSSRSRRWAMWS